MRSVLLALLASIAPATSVLAHGVVVEEAREGSAAHRAGLRTGDVLLRWERAASPPYNPEPAHGDLNSPFDLDDVEREQAPRGPVSLFGTREGGPVAIVVPAGRWRLRARPAFETAAAQAYEDAKAMVAGAAYEQGLSLMRESALAWRFRGDHAGSIWLFYVLALAAAEKQQWQTAEDAFREALAAAEARGDSAAQKKIHASIGRSLEDRHEWDRAMAAYREALEVCRAPSASLGEALVLDDLGAVTWKRGDLTAALEYYQRALEIRTRMVPEGVDTARTLNNLGAVAGTRGDMAAADEYFRRSLALREKLMPDSEELATSFNNLGGVATSRGDLAAAEDYFTRSLALKGKLVPGSLTVAATLNNLGSVAEMRDDLDGAEEYHRRALAIKEARAPASLDVAISLTNLGIVAERRGDRDSATEYHERALAIRRKLAPEGLDVAMSLHHLARVTEERGDLTAAEQQARQAMAIREALAPESGHVAASVSYLGHLALRKGDLAAAEARYQHSLAIRRRLAAGSAGEAEACERLATIARRRARTEEALAFYRCALDALDTQRLRLGGTDEDRSRFMARHAGYYRDALDLLVEAGRPEEAFHVLERYRARGLLALLAARDMVFSTDLPVELDRERRMANAEYDAALSRLADRKGKVEEAREALVAARKRRSSVQDRIRTASPRLSALEYPEPLDLAATRRAVDPGTLVLSYSIGDARSYLFAAGPGPQDFAAITLDTNLPKLRVEVARLRELLARGGRMQTRALQAAAARLGDVLLGPVAARIGAAERVLVVPDGPLHVVPFSVLGDPTHKTRFRHLIEATPVHVAASATVFAELARGRGAPRAPQLVAFGDPDYSSAATLPGAAASPAGVRLARERGLELRPLPASRKEVEAIERLYGGAARAYLGPEATEDKAKTDSKTASLLHFACHGIADEKSPLDSALALTLPREWHPDRDNGLLQAWEIFEQVRIDADLVTLSACGTALGQEMSGEGILGLTRAFQYAGARTVLASLWGVADESTAVLMKSFYGHLKRGLSKDAALRTAQLELLRRPSTAHPYHWAAFQLIGDWK